ncbi:MAG: hypothetical protein JW862_07985, partial [Anaerolineales bacterium]|nr:hypothetical protein [Anaerolineales bacterium]
GDGRIEIVANQSDSPRISVHLQGTSYNSTTEAVRIGNMRDAFGIGANDYYGLGLGDYSGGNYLRYDENGGFRIVGGNGEITLDDAGISLVEGDGSAKESEIAWGLTLPISASNRVARMLGLTSSGMSALHVAATGNGTNNDAYVVIEAASGDGSVWDIGIESSSPHAGIYMFADYSDGTASEVVLSTRTSPTLDFSPLLRLTRDHLALEGSGSFLVGTSTDDAKVTMGIVINQGSNTDNVMSLKNSGVAHGMTTFAETDTFGAIQIFESGAGGVRLEGYKDSDGIAGGSVSIRGYLAENADTTKDRTARGIIELTAGIKSSGTGAQVANNDGNLLVIRDYDQTRVIVNSYGSILHDASSYPNHYDEYNDIQLLAAMRQTMVPAIGQLTEDVLAGCRDVLEQSGIVTYADDGSRFVDGLGLQMLTIDAVRQVHQMLTAENAALHERVARLEQAIH